jgi:hypothetical protein
MKGVNKVTAKFNGKTVPKEGQEILIVKTFFAMDSKYQGMRTVAKRDGSVDSEGESVLLYPTDLGTSLIFITEWKKIPKYAKQVKK